MLKYIPSKLQKDIMHCASYELLNILKKQGVNPKTITEVAVIDCLAIIKMSYRFYATNAITAGYEGAGPYALKELMEWCGCDNPRIFDAINHNSRVHFFRNEYNHWIIIREPPQDE